MQATPAAPEPLVKRLLRIAGGLLAITAALLVFMFLQFRRTAKPQKAPPKF